MQLLMLPILFGLVAIAIPVIIHLLHKQKTTPIAWVAMQFLIPTKLQAKRRKKVEHWLLMLMRVAALAVLVLLLARPVWKSNPFNSPDDNASADVAVVIDHSFSVGRAATDNFSSPDAHHSVFERAIAVTHDIAAQLRPGDSLTIVLAEHQPRALNDRPVAGASVELTQLRQALGRLKTGLSDSDIPAAVQVARERISHGRNSAKRIIILGDEQRSGWRVDNLAQWKTAVTDGGTIDKNLAIFDVPIAVDPSVSNVSLSRLDIHPAVIGTGRPVEISATLTNSSAMPFSHLPVSLTVDGQPAGTQILDELPAGTSRAIRFEQSFTKGGSHWAKVNVQVVDGLEADNTAVAGLNVLDKLPVLIIDGQLTGAGGIGAFRNSQFLAAAMEPIDTGTGETSLIRPKIVGAADSSLGNFDEFAAVVVNDVAQLPPQVMSRLADYAAAGHGVWIILGPHAQPKWMSEQLENTGLFFGELSPSVKLIGTDAAHPAASVVVRDVTNPMVSLLTASNRNGFADAVAMGWWPIKPTQDDERIILATASGEPLIFERLIGHRGGRIVLWATSADGEWNNWPLVTHFVPLVQETMLHLAGNAVGAGSGVIDAGKPLIWSPAPKLTQSGVTWPNVISASITRPDGTVPARALSESGKPVVRYDQADIPGLYELRLTPTDIPQPIYFGVGIICELDPSTLTPGDLNMFTSQGLVTARLPLEKINTLMSHDAGKNELWPWMTLVVLGMLLMETFLTYRMIRLQTSKRAVV